MGLLIGGSVVTVFEVLDMIIYNMILKQWKKKEVNTVFYIRFLLSENKLTTVPDVEKIPRYKQNDSFNVIHVCNVYLLWSLD